MGDLAKDVLAPGETMLPEGFEVIEVERVGYQFVFCIKLSLENDPTTLEEVARIISDGGGETVGEWQRCNVQTVAITALARLWPALNGEN